MRIPIFLLLFFGILILPASAEKAGSYNPQKAIVGKTDPEFDATLPASPLNHFIRDVFHPDHPIEGEPTSYEEVVPVESGHYYENEGHYYEKEKPSATTKSSPKEENKTYYEEGGRFYPSPEEKKK